MQRSHGSCVQKLRGSREKRSKSSVQFEEAREGGKFEEDGQMEVDEDVDTKKKMDQRMKKPQKLLRDSELFTGIHSLLAQRKNGFKSFKILNEDGMISCWSIQNAQNVANVAEPAGQKKSSSKKDLETVSGSRMR